MDDKMSSKLGNMLDGPGMINPAYYKEHHIPVPEAESGMNYMGMGAGSMLNLRINPNGNTENSTVVVEEEWICSCGAKNNSKYCGECGNRRPE